MRARNFYYERRLIRQLDRCYKRQPEEVKRHIKEYYDFTVPFLRFYASEFSGRNFAHVGKRHLKAYVIHMRTLGYTEELIYKNIEGIAEMYPLTCGRNWIPPFKDLGVRYEEDCSDYLMGVIPKTATEITFLGPDLNEYEEE